MKEIVWMGNSYKALKSFPDDAIDSAGYQLHLLQIGEQPVDWKPMNSVGNGVQEIRIKEESGTFRVIYVAKFEEALYVLHTPSRKKRRRPHRRI